MPDYSTAPRSRAMIGKWSVERYVELLRNWVIGIAVILVVLVLDQKPQGLVVLIEALFMLLVGWLVRRAQGGRVESLTAGAMSGLALGLVISISRFVVVPKLYWAVNIIVETLLTGFVATWLAVVGHILTGFFPSSTPKTN